MISLTELLKHIHKKEQNGLVAIEEWRWPDVDHLASMGFEFGDEYHLITPREPKISVCKKTEIDDTTGKEKDYYYVEEEEKGREKKRFGSFKDLIDYFDTYEQPEIDKYREEC